MKLNRLLHFVALSLVMVAALGCGQHYYAVAPIVPPAYVEAPPIVQAAERNGFRTGESDGARDAVDGHRYSALATRAYRDTPGFDSGMGPFRAYREAFRSAYLRGYDKGFRRG